MCLWFHICIFDESVTYFAFFQIHGHDEYFKKEKKKAHPGIKGNVQS